MLFQTTNFTVTPNLSKNIPFAPRTISNSADSFEMIGASMSFARNAEIYGENEPAEYLYKLVSGSVRTSKILDDGRRQIGAFYLPGDIFGFEVSSEHSSSAEAISDAKVIVVKRSAIEALAARDSD
ncbi:MAG: cyclic nucleotide-binding domain-containing protein, partial [Pseudolabrys sp.]